MPDTPQLLAKVKKKLNSLTLDYDGNELTLDIVNDEIDLILVDMWLTDILIDIHDKVELRKKLTGGKGDSDSASFKGFSSL